MRIVFAGTPSAAVPALRALSERHEVLAVVTRPDAPVGRKRVLATSPVAAAAASLGLPVLKSAKFTDEVSARLAELRPELGVIVAYGALAPDHVLAIPTHGWINLHFSLLPRWRGAAPVQRSIEARDTLGVSVIQVEHALDAGDIWMQEVADLPDSVTAAGALDALGLSGASTLLRAIDAIAAGATPRPQVGEITIAKKLHHDDGHVDWGSDSANILAHIRAVTSEPGAWSLLDGEEFKIHEARAATTPANENTAAGATDQHGRSVAGASGADRRDGDAVPGSVAQADGRVLVSTGSGAIELVEVQPFAKRRMAAADWFRGRQHAEATVLS